MIRAQFMIRFWRGALKSVGRIWSRWKFSTVWIANRAPPSRNGSARAEHHDAS